ncbi:MULTISPECIES: plastocyanin/azurin family copper-binding protein [Haloarcula]|uniref:plastocyanin/azurin family copper-binding protein n=1 Tax=Haloarcula TaxID=2237 RepID=UPI0023EDAAFC|nr:plastocyanin/azurin family copper-binding protein [Halomicroarcula sp. XH51]
MSRDTHGPYRRDVMKTIGAGAAVSVLGGAAMAQEDDDEGAEGEMDHGSGTVHTVRTLISGPPTNPERPADFFFQPTGLHVQPGDVVKFVFTTPDHNVVSYHPAFGMRRRVPVGVDAFSSPLQGWRADTIADDQIEPPAEPGEDGEADEDDEDEEAGEDDEDGENGDEEEEEASAPVPSTWLHAFETEGVYDILCSPHEGFGMTLRVVVGDVEEAPFETSTPDNLAPPRAGPVGLARVTLTDPALEPANIVEQGRVPWQALSANRGGQG